VASFCAHSRPESTMRQRLRRELEHALQSFCDRRLALWRVSACRTDEQDAHRDHCRGARLLAEARFISSATGGADRDHAPRPGGRKKWIEEQRFLQRAHLLRAAASPEAQKLATYAGCCFHGVRGRPCRGRVCFVLPGALVMLALSSPTPLDAASLPWRAPCSASSGGAGDRVEALLRIGRRALKTAS